VTVYSQAFSLLFSLTVLDIEALSSDRAFFMRYLEKTGLPIVLPALIAADLEFTAWFKVPGSPFTVEGKTDSRFPTVNLEP
jgi:hypothetical protein